jgi:RNA polymerase sigma-70 factor (ECF subfamily)
VADDDDGALINRYLEGDPGSFEEIVRRHGPPILGYLRWRTRDAALAEDVLQEMFMRALKGLRSYRHRDRLRAWLIRIARNLVIDHERRAGGRLVELDAPLVAGETAGTTLGDLLPAPARYEPEPEAERRELAAAARKALDHLVPVQREVFLMRQSGLSFKEIAKVQGCSINTALGRMYDAVNHLRGVLSDLEKGTT